MYLVNNKHSVGICENVTYVVFSTIMKVGLNWLLDVAIANYTIFFFPLESFFSKVQGHFTKTIKLVNFEKRSYVNVTFSQTLCCDAFL